MVDDVNDAAWILVHVGFDISPRGHEATFSVEERVRLLEAARLYIAVAARYQPEMAVTADV